MKDKENINKFEFTQKLFFIVEAIDYLNKKTGPIIPISELKKESVRNAKKAQVNFTKEDFNIFFEKIMMAGYLFCPRNGYAQKVGDLLK